MLIGRDWCRTWCRQLLWYQTGFGLYYERVSTSLPVFMQLFEVSRCVSYLYIPACTMGVDGVDFYAIFFRLCIIRHSKRIVLMGSSHARSVGLRSSMIDAAWKHCAYTCLAAHRYCYLLPNHANLLPSVQTPDVSQCKSQLTCKVPPFISTPTLCCCVEN